MAKTEREGRILQIMTETDDEAVHTRKRLKGGFLEKDKMQMSSYIKDLEKTLAINKGILSDLLKAERSDSSLKVVLEKLNAENAALQLQLKKAVRERDDYQARLLISEQVAEEFRGRENEMLQQYEDKAREYVDQLNRKEYVLQSYERRYNRAMSVLKKYTERDGEVRMLLKDWTENENDRRCITNVVEENEALFTEVKTARQKVAEIQTKFTQMARTTNATEEIPALAKPLMKRQNDSNSKEQPPGRVRTVESTNKPLNEIMTHLQADRDAIAVKIRQLEDANEGLRRLNTELSGKLAAARSELAATSSRTKSSSRPERRRRNFSSADVDAPNPVEHRPGMGGIIIEQCDSFAEVSSIHECDLGMDAESQQG